MTTEFGNRIAPVQEDLARGEDLTLQIKRGFEGSNRKDYPVATPADQILRGEWAVLSGGKFERPSASTPKKNSYLIFRGQEGWDSHATGAITAFIASTNMIVQTNKFEAGGTYVAGTLLWAKLVGGEGVLAEADSDAKKAAAVAEVLEVAATYLLVKVLS